MALSSTEEDNRVYFNARVLVALRKCLVRLQDFNLGPQDIPPFVANEPHPRYFPYPTSFKAKDGTLTRFRYIKSLEEDAGCVTYLADIANETVDSVKVVVKLPSDTVALCQGPRFPVFFPDPPNALLLVFACGRISCIWL